LLDESDSTRTLESMRDRSSMEDSILKGPKMAPRPTAVDGSQSVAESKCTKNAAAVALGRLGGLKGGHARAASLSADQRKDVAQRAARARWNTKSKGGEE